MTAVSWTVGVELSLEGAELAVKKYAKGLQAHLERICPMYRPRVVSKQGVCRAEFDVSAATEAAAVGKATYWLRRAIQRERTLKWTSDLVGETTARRHAA